MSVLYTNRAQTHIKLGNFEDALNDCDWALRVSAQSVHEITMYTYCFNFYYSI